MTNRGRKPLRHGQRIRVKPARSGGFDPIPVMIIVETEGYWCQHIFLAPHYMQVGNVWARYVDKHLRELYYTPLPEEGGFLPYASVEHIVDRLVMNLDATKTVKLLRRMPIVTFRAGHPSTVKDLEDAGLGLLPWDVQERIIERNKAVDRQK